MKRNPNSRIDVIARDQVRIAAQAAMLDCGTGEDGRPTPPLAVVPVLDGDRIAGFEVRCGCGAAALVECVYETDAEPPDSTRDDQSQEQTS